MVVIVDFIPYETKYIFTLTVDVFEDLVERLF
jgi:hypothetical protein